jgi:DNA-directed RNA polymerase alpha subunit
MMMMDRTKVFETLANAGWTQKRIGEAFGVSGQTVSAALRKRHRDRNAPPPPKDFVGLTPRTRNCLKNLNCETRSDVLKLKVQDLVFCPHMGRKSFIEISNLIWS